MEPETVLYIVAIVGAFASGAVVMAAALMYALAREAIRTRHQRFERE